MGASGTAIFSDDLAADIRGDWRDLILNEVEPEAATERLIDEYDYAVHDADDRVIFWLALAAAQMETGRLQDAVAACALEIIDAGGDVARWEAEDPPAARRRQQSLDALAVKLRGPQGKPKRLRRAKPMGVEFDIGDAVLVSPEGSEEQALVVVVDQAESYPRGGTFPVVEFLVWDASEPLPDADAVATIPAMVYKHPHSLHPEARPEMRAVTTHRKDQIFGPHIGRVVARGVRRSPSGDHRNGSAMTEAGASSSSWTFIAGYVANGQFARDLAHARSVLADRSQRRGFWRRRER